MVEETAHITKTPTQVATTPVQEKTVTTTTAVPTNDTIFGGVSVRGWLVIILTMTVCMISAYNQIYKSTNNVIEEPLYSGFMIALGYYFGQKNK